MVAYYPFDGNANDESVNGNDGTEHGGLNYAAGKIGQAAQFDGIDAYIQITPKSDVSKIGDFTIVTWVFLEDWKEQNPDRQYIFDGHSHSSTTTSDFYSPGFGLIYDRRASREEIHNFIYGSSSSLSEQNTPVPIGRSWHHLLFMRKGKDDFTYFDGELLSATYSWKQAIEEPLNMAHNWFIGTFSGNNPHYNNGVFNYSFFGSIDELRIYNRALSEDEIQTLYQQTNAAACQLYAVQDTGLNNSQFFTVDPVTFEVKALGDMKKAHDIEALDTHPQTTELFAASGKDTKKPGYLYSVDKNSGKLTDIGPTGFKEIDGLSFHPDGTLWGWASGDGLVTIDTTGKAKLVAAYPGEVEDLTWNTAGTILFAVENLRNNPDTGVKLLAYDGNTLKTVCEEVTQLLEIEALDTLPDDTLIFGLHGKTSLPLGAIDVTTCQIIAEKEIATNYNDVEGIAWPEKVCAPQVARSCQEIKENAPSSEDGVYLIDPDGKGGNEPFEVYCDMTHEGGGWTLYAHHADGIATIQTQELVNPSDYAVMTNSHWLTVRDSMTTGMMFLDEQGRVSTISAAKLTSGNCISIQQVSDLTNNEFSIWHNENSGCSRTGGDYSLIQLFGEKHHSSGAALFQESSLKFDKWPYSEIFSGNQQNTLLYFIK